MQFLKKSILILFLAMFISWPAWGGPSIPEPPAVNTYLHDYARMVEARHAREIMAVGAALEKATGAEIVVVTVDSLDGYPIEDYANALFRSWGIGDKTKNNGVLLLVNKEKVLKGERGRVRIEVGYGLEGAIPDGKAGRILDEYVLPPWETGDYSKGIYQGYMAIANAVAKEYQVDINTEEALAHLEDYNLDEVEGLNLPLGILIFLVIVIFFASLSQRGGKGGPWHHSGPGTFWSGPFMGGGGFGSGGFGGGGFGGFGGGSSGGGGASR